MYLRVLLRLYLLSIDDVILRHRFSNCRKKHWKLRAHFKKKGKKTLKRHKYFILRPILTNFNTFCLERRILYMNAKIYKGLEYVVFFVCFKANLNRKILPQNVEMINLIILYIFVIYINTTVWKLLLSNIKFSSTSIKFIVNISYWITVCLYSSFTSIQEMLTY